LDNVKGVFDEVKHEFYTSPALVPPMTWQDSIPPTTPSEPSFQAQSDRSIRLKWSASKDNHDLPVSYHLYGSNVYPVDTQDAGNLVQTYLRDNETTIKDMKGKRYFAITATDRYGNESQALAINKPSATDIPILNQGNKLMLPPLDNTQEVLICNSVGKMVSKVKYHREISLELLPKGFYWVYALKTNGERKLIGSIMK
jgi:hypothetical protein